MGRLLSTQRALCAAHATACARHSLMLPACGFVHEESCIKPLHGDSCMGHPAAMHPSGCITAGCMLHAAWRLVPLTSGLSALRLRPAGQAGSLASAYVLCTLSAQDRQSPLRLRQYHQGWGIMPLRFLIIDQSAYKPAAAGPGARWWQLSFRLSV